MFPSHDRGEWTREKLKKADRFIEWDLDNEIDCEQLVLMGVLEKEYKIVYYGVSPRATVMDMNYSSPNLPTYKEKHFYRFPEQSFGVNYDPSIITSVVY